MEKIINTLINSSIQGVDTYTHNDSTWLIFTESKQWVIELTGHQTLWYNYNFFKNIFAYVSLDAVQNQHLITKWVEDNVINKVEHTQTNSNRNILKVEDTLQNGVKKTKMAHMKTDWSVEDTLQNGVKNIIPTNTNLSRDVEDIIQNGVIDTQSNPYENKSWIEGVIKKGVKETRLEMNITEGEVDDIIQDGVKETLPLESREYTGDIDEVLENSVRSPIPRQYVGKDIIDKIIDKGVIETSHRRYLQTFNPINTIQDGTENDYWVMDGCNTPVDEAIENGIKEVISYDECKSGFVNQFGYLDDIIDNGVKEVHPLPAQDWNGDWGKYYHGKEDKTKPFNEYLNETLEKGVKIN